jgi:hypothetical protein
MKKVRKLTPATLRRIIAEERLKIKKELSKDNSKNIKSKNSNSLLAEIKKLIRLKKAQKRNIDQLKKINEARRSIKRKLLKRL